MDVTVDDLDTLDVDYDMAKDEGETDTMDKLFRGLLDVAKDLRDDLRFAKDEISDLETDLEDARDSSEEFDGSYHGMRDAMLRNFDGSLGDRLILEEMFNEFETKVGINHLST